MPQKNKITVPGRSTINAKKVETEKSDTCSEQVVDLYIGIFFDGTNNNKYQTMLGKKFRRDKLFEKYKSKLEEQNITNPNKIITEPRVYWEKLKIFTKSELDQLYFGIEDINSKAKGNNACFMEKHISKTLNNNKIDQKGEYKNIGNVMSSISDSQSGNDELKKVADSFISEDTEKGGSYSHLEGRFAQAATYTNVAILESLYVLKADTDTEKHYSIYIEGSGTDMILIPQLKASHSIFTYVAGELVKLGIKKGVDYVAGDFNDFLDKDSRNLSIDHGVDYVVYKTNDKVAKTMTEINEVIGLGFGVGATGVTAKTKKTAAMIQQKINALISHHGTVLKLHFDLFGFSRGAATARVFNYAIDGNKENPTQNGGKVTPEDLKMITGIDQYLNLSEAESRIKSKEVRFMGIFDTVASIGVFRDNGVLEEKIAKQLRKKNTEYTEYNKEPYHDRNVDNFGLYATDQAQKVFHICALDEVRQNFALVDIESSIGTNGLELFIPGCHTDIGGGAAIGREDEKIVNLMSINGVKNYICNRQSFSRKSMKYEPIYVKTLEYMGWLNSSQLTESKTMMGRPSKKAKNDSDDTVYTDNDGNWHTRNNIIMNRYVTPGYSNVALHLMREKGGEDMFKPIPPSYAVPLNLSDYYEKLKSKISQKGRFFVNPTWGTYYWLRNIWLHYSANDQLLDLADNLVVNPPTYASAFLNSKADRYDKIGSDEISSINNTISGDKDKIFANEVKVNNIRLASRIIYHGKKDISKDDKIDFMFDYMGSGFNVSTKSCHMLLTKRKEELMIERKAIEEEIEKLISQCNLLMDEMNNSRNVKTTTVLFNNKMECERQISAKEKQLVLVDEQLEEINKELG